MRQTRPALLLVAAQLLVFDLRTRINAVKDAGARAVVVILRSDDRDDVRALEAGADDFVDEPTIARDLELRVRVLMRRMQPHQRRELEYGDLVIDLAAREVRVGEEMIDLTTREFDLLAFLASEPRVVFTREELLDLVWGTSPEWQSVATVTEHIRRIRTKLEDERGERWLRTVRGVGYAFKP